ncbi:MAG: tetratricopeptide repeat protein, partial [Rhodosalinus sp.]
LPVALILIDITFFRRFNRWHAAALGLVGVGIAIAAPILASSAFTHFLEAPGHRDFSGWERLLTQGRVIVHYLSLLVWPDASRLQLDYDFVVSRGLFEPVTTLPAWLFLGALSGAALLAVRRYPWPAFGWLFFMLALSIESSVILLELAFEHRLYLPSTLLFAGILAPLFSAEGLGVRARYTGIVVLAVAGLLAWQTMERNTEWNDRGRFWAKDLERGASPYRSALNGALGLIDQGYPEQALDILAYVPEELEPHESAKVAMARGRALMMGGRPEEAVEAFTDALDEVPRDTRVAFSVALAMIAADDIEAAKDLTDQIQESAPDSGYARLLQAELDREAGDFDSARERLEGLLAESLSRSSSGAHVVRMNLANVYRALDRPSDAADQYRAIIDENPKHWAAWSNLYLMLEAGDDPGAERIAEFLEARGVDPHAWAPEDADDGAAPLPSEAPAAD